jgi:hypothetical protein
VVLPPSNNPYWSNFTIRNGGDTSIGKRDITCSPIMYTHSDGTIGLEVTGFDEQFPVTNAEMGPGGAETNNCLALIGPSDARCLDVMLTINYVLVTQPKLQQIKQWRFVATAANGLFQWQEQPIGEPHSYCTLYLNPKAQQEYMSKPPLPLPRPR